MILKFKRVVKKKISKERIKTKWDFLWKMIHLNSKNLNMKNKI